MAQKIIRGTEKYTKKKTIESGDLLALKIEKAIATKKELDRLKEQLKEYQDYFLQLFDATGQTQLVTGRGVAKLKIANSYKIDPTMFDKLKEIFKKDTKKYVEEKTEYRPTAAYKNLAMDADYPNSQLIRKAMVIKQIKSIEFYAGGENGK
ncbi:MAG TPA: hypothetical protein DCW42_08210 [Bacteroidetes bacterium]|jgi:hypothetical protein|nr:hypothetical protein [Bacteroidota bacterium]